MKSKFINDVNEIYKQYYISTRKSRPLMTKFERAKILSIRAQQIEAGMPVLIHPDKIPLTMVDTYEIAKLELKAKKTPIIICRNIDNVTEYWKIEDFINI
jgi:DNA-directed RNA polymerases I, II, and III subunit RPABC2